MASSFEAELETLVQKFARELAEQVTSLILGRLGIERGARSPGARSALDAAPRRGPKPAAAKPAGAKRTRSTTEQRSAAMEKVAQILATTPGLSISEIEKRAGLSRNAALGVLKALKDDKRAFMGGTRRFARYAATQAAADKASTEARS